MVETPGARRGRRRPTREEGPAATLAQVVDVAYRIARTEHLDQVQIRRVARELGVWPQAVYYYVPSKTALLHLVTERAMATRRPTDLGPGESWDRRLLDLLRRTTDVFTAHPGLAWFVVTQPDYVDMSGPGMLAEEVLVLLFEGGLTPTEALSAFVALSSMIIGGTELRAAFGQALVVPPVDAERFPLTARTVAAAAGAELVDGAETYIAGLVALSDRRAGREASTGTAR